MYLKLAQIRRLVLKISAFVLMVLFMVLLPVILCFLVKILDAALKQFKSLAPKTPVLLFSVDEENSKIICLAQVPKVCYLN